MAKFARVFISPTHRLFLSLTFGLIVFGAMLFAAGWYSIHRATEMMNVEVEKAHRHFVELQQSILHTFSIVERDLTAAPCTGEFNNQLRRIAYLPDRLSEFLYAPDGQVVCSVSIHRFETAINLGEPDIVRANGKLWVNRDLAFLGLEGERGSIVLRGAVAAVVPVEAANFSTPDWLAVEGVMRSDTGQWWHRGGIEGTYHYVSSEPESWFLGDDLSTVNCGPLGLHCVAARIDFWSLVKSYQPLIEAATALMLLLAVLLAREFDKLMRRYWSFDARVRRYLNAESVVCAYQPLMSLDNGEITGCEVLARWRDIDGSVVFPDRFLHLIENENMTMHFTELVAQRACSELSELLPQGRRLQVNFNIFPRDLDHQRLLAIYSGFLAQPERFDVVLEIIESDEIPPNAQHEIEMLRAHGVKTYIDDFGTGYSNMQSLAALSVDGVKLDRAFAMAADDTMMARMLHHAIDMIHATGRVMVVEGVETGERLALLRQLTARIDFVQGYYISKPLQICPFVEYLESRLQAGSVSGVQPKQASS